MFNLKSLLNQCLFAAALAGAAVGASAAPTSFHVNVDTTSLSGPGLLSLGFGQTGGAGLVTATVSNLTGSTGAIAPTGDVVLGANSFTIANSVVPDGSFADIDALFGGMFGFDIAFTGDFMNETGSEVSSLYLYLLDSAYGTLAGDQFTGVASFTIGQGVDIVADPTNLGFVSIAPLAAAAVPEPSQLLLMLAGLAMMGAVIRRRAR